jgi:myo-inositol-hexaphosphate 3-phosphohydrolase
MQLGQSVRVRRQALQHCSHGAHIDATFDLQDDTKLQGQEIELEKSPQENNPAIAVYVEWGNRLKLPTWKSVHDSCSITTGAK